METDERNTSDEVNDKIKNIPEDCESYNDEQDSVAEDRNKSCEVIQANNGFVVITDNGTLIALNMEEALDIVRGVLG